jgi:hypothetical protein
MLSSILLLLLYKTVTRASTVVCHALAPVILAPTPLTEV